MKARTQEGFRGYCSDAKLEKLTDVVIKLTTTNICGSDLHMYEGRTDVEKGKILGHENLGEVVEVGKAVDTVKKGDKVGSSEAALLAKLGIRPFSYGLVVKTVYDDGSVFDPEVLDLTEDDLIEKFAAGISTVTALSLAISYPTIAAVPHAIINGYKNVLAVAIELDYSFPLAEKVKEYLKDPSKFAVAAAPVAGATEAAPAAAAPKEEEKKPEPEEESEEDMGFSLFD